MTTTVPSVHDADHNDAWDKNADFWIRIIREGLDRYRIELTDPWVLETIGDCRGLSALDAGCGEGYMARELAKRGASFVAGVDTCAPLIEAARDAAPDGVHSTFEVADMADAPFVDETFDIIVANHSINEVDDPGPTFREFARLLRPGGNVTLLMLHPCFFSWAGGHEKSLSAYTMGRQGHKPYKVAGITSPAVATARVGTLETYAQGLCDAGFLISAIREPRPTEAQVDDPWWAERANPPKFLIMKATKASPARIT